jgi:tetratricopeptide (TPR) repeat protein
MKNTFFLLVNLMVILIYTTQAQDFDQKLNDAKMAMMDRNYSSGLEICESLIASQTGDSTQLSSAYAYAGMACEALKRTPDAINYYQKAVAMKIPQLDIYEKLISLSKKEKNNEVYEFALNAKAAEFPEDYQDIAKSLANHYANTQQYEKLLSKTDELLNWEPDNINYLFFKAVALQQTGKADESKEYYKKVLALDPNHPGANMSIGLMLFNEGTAIFDKRKKEYESIAKPDRVDYYNYEKGIEKGKEIYREALPYLLKAYESGSYPNLKAALFRSYSLLEEKQKADLYK